jgi:hypothetical protein
MADSATSRFGGGELGGGGAPAPGFFTMNWCKQAGHFIVIPEGGMRRSSRSYWAPQLSQATFISGAPS